MTKKKKNIKNLTIWSILIAIIIFLFFTLLITYIQLREYKIKMHYELMAQAQNCVIVKQDYLLQNANETIQDLSNKIEVKWKKKITVTAYTARKEECDSDSEHTATMKKVIPGLHCAVSQKLWDDGWTFGHRVYIQGYGVFEIQDKPNKKYDNEYRIDLLVGTVEQANKIGVNKEINACLIVGEV